VLTIYAYLLCPISCLFVVEGLDLDQEQRSYPQWASEDISASLVRSGDFRLFKIGESFVYAGQGFHSIFQGAQLGVPLLHLLKTNLNDFLNLTLPGTYLLSL
jgi:hypothetical protein